MNFFLFLSRIFFVRKWHFGVVLLLLQQSLLNSVGGVGHVGAWVPEWHGSNFGLVGVGGMGL